MEPGPPALGAWSLGRWTTTEVPPDLSCGCCYCPEVTIEQKESLREAKAILWRSFECRSACLHPAPLCPPGAWMEWTEQQTERNEPVEAKREAGGDT